MSKVRIAGKGIGTKIEIDGQQVNGCVAYRLRQSAGAVARLTLQILATEVEIESDADVDADRVSLERNTIRSLTEQLARARAELRRHADEQVVTCGEGQL